MTLRESALYAMVKLSNRSWYQCRYRDGRILSEWETLHQSWLNPFGRGSTSRWEDIEKDGLIGLRLLCPNGMCGELEAAEDHKFFQLKVGIVGTSSPQSFASAHVIGAVDGPQGQCLCWAWLVREFQLIQFRDNVYAFAFEHLGPLALDPQGLRL